MKKKIQRPAGFKPTFLGWEARLIFSFLYPNFFLFLKIPRIIFALFQGHAKEEKKEERRVANNR